MKKISVIIPAYNAEKTLPETLDSITKQTYNNYEVLIIDDGSKDNTAKIAKKYSDKNKKIKYYYKANGGVSSARNKGLDLSTGHYICFLDADDYFDKKYLEKMSKKLMETKSELCYCGFNIITEKDIRQSKIKFTEKNLLLNYILTKTYVQIAGWMMERSLLIKNKIKFMEGVSWAEDFDFFNEVISSTNKICFVKEYMVNYKADHSEQQLSNFSLDKIDKDYESIMRNINNPKVNKNKAIEKALLNYRLQALIINKLIIAKSINANEDEIELYFKKYNKYIKFFTFNNGFKSFKLNLSKIKLLLLMRKP